jgi:hypothetical protein
LTSTPLAVQHAPRDTPREPRPILAPYAILIGTPTPNAGNNTRKKSKKAHETRRAAHHVTTNWRIALINSASVQANAIKASNKPAPAVTFIMDSGAMKHFTNTKEGLINFDPNKKTTVELADKSRITTDGYITRGHI